MRVFIACSIPRFSELNNLFFKLQNFHGTRVVNTPELHLTFRFFGELNEDEARDLCAQFENLKLRKFILTISGLGCFPKLEKARILYLNVTESEELLLDYKKISELKFATREEKKDFIPHLTVARMRIPRDLRTIIEEFNNIHWVQEIEHLSIYKSTLTNSGPVYDVLGETQLI